MQLLFVCTGNTCRSPMAEAAAQKWITDNPEEYAEFRVTSAGVLCAGAAPASDYAQIVAEQNGCDLSKHLAKQVSGPLLEQADYIFTMTRGHKQMLERMAPQYQDKIYLLNAYAEGNLDAADVPDPYGGSLETYLHCFAVLNTSIEKILKKLK